jgi:NADH:ubiquinone oxidoreductase subunit F (NADH-binding)
VSVHGELPSWQRSPRTTLHPLIDEVERAGLRGHGGAGFPASTKLRAVAAMGGRPVVVVNGCEGEPTSEKDHMLLELLPHLVIDGALLAAQAVGSREIILAVEREAVSAVDTAEWGLAERPELNFRCVSARVQGIPGGYVSGQETAVINALRGGPALPTTTPPYPFERGVARRPTLVSNVETLAHIALIARHGADWYRELGTRDDPGSRLVTVSGAVTQPGVLEIATGTRLPSVIKAAGGATERLDAFLLGGYAGTWIAAETETPRLESDAMRRHGATLGAGIVFAFGASACPVAEVARVARWLSEHSAGQCGPCIHGMDAIADSLAELCQDGDRTGGYAHLKRWCHLVTGRGACALPDGGARFVRSALTVFAEDFEDHARHGRCEACLRRPVLPVPGHAEMLAR